ncbi:MAG: helix-turn-helix domain-containing protein [Chloroflexota bacterium]|nr:helix-turn-helix domain-containing protein [Chloroflexota bacterium]
MYKKYVVQLSDSERRHLRTLIRKGQESARILARARVLLLADEGYTDDQIAACVHVGTTTIERLRRRFTEGGLDATLHDRPRPGGTPKLDGKQEALLVALTCSEPPDDRPHWTMQLLADQLVAIGVVDTISDETVRHVLKKTRSNPG